MRLQIKLSHSRQGVIPARLPKNTGLARCTRSRSSVASAVRSARLPSRICSSGVKRDFGMRSRTSALLRGYRSANTFSTGSMSVWKSGTDIPINIIPKEPIANSSRQSSS
jgi:hypothetical protein